MACAAERGVILGLQVVESPPWQAPSLGVREPITGTEMLSCPISGSLEMAQHFGSSPMARWTLIPEKCSALAHFLAAESSRWGDVVTRRYVSRRYDQSFQVRVAGRTGARGAASCIMQATKRWQVVLERVVDECGGSERRSYEAWGTWRLPSRSGNRESSSKSSDMINQASTALPALATRVSTVGD